MERPILFSAPMVRAILAGAKTQTRRLVKPQPEPNDYGTYSWPSNVAKTMVETRDMGSLSPYGWRGDRLWVREAWRPSISHGCGMDACDCDTVAVDYLADAKGAEPRFFYGDQVPDAWCMPKRSGGQPSIHMPRWASRIDLEVTGVRVERLTDISEDDARAEGVEDVRTWLVTPRGCISEEQRLTSGERMVDAPYRASFAILWDEINGDRALWKSNPWIWVVSFRRVERAKAVA